MIEGDVAVVVAVGKILGILGVILSILFPEHRIWPPPCKDSWQFWVTWTVLTIGTMGVLAIGILDWRSIGFQCSYLNTYRRD